MYVYLLTYLLVKTKSTIQKLKKKMLLMPWHHGAAAAGGAADGATG